MTSYTLNKTIFRNDCCALPGTHNLRTAINKKDYTRGLPKFNLFFLVVHISDFEHLIQNKLIRLTREAVWFSKSFFVSVGGDRIENILWRLENGLMEKISLLKPVLKRIIFMAGTNDLNGCVNENDEVPQLVRKIDYVLELIRQRVVGVCICVIAPPSDVYKSRKFELLSFQLHQMCIEKVFIFVRSLRKKLK